MIRPISIEEPVYAQTDSPYLKTVVMVSSDGTIPATGADVDGLDNRIKFSAGSVVVDTANGALYVHDGSDFVLWNQGE